MRFIKIINGTYGYRPDGLKRIEPKQAGDPPFEVEDEEAARLVSLNVAIYVSATASIQKKPDEPVATPAEGTDSMDTGVNPPMQEGSGEGEKNTPATPPEYSTELSAADLRDLMARYGVAVKFGMSKADMVESLDQYFNVAEDEDVEDDNGEVEDGEEPPIPTVEEPIR